MNVIAVTVESIELRWGRSVGIFAIGASGPGKVISNRAVETSLNNKPLSSVYRDATRAALLGLVINLALGLTKLIGGLVGDSFALLSDAVNSLGDVFTSAVVLFAFRVAQRPADKEHPYGHTRAEAIAASNVALLVISSAVFVGWEAVRRIQVQHDVPPVWTLWIAGFNMLIKESLYHYKVRVGRRTGSTALIANAWDHRSDALCAFAVLVGLSIVRWGGPRFISADEIAAMVVVTAIIVSGASLFHNSAHELMDVQAEESFVQSLRRAAASVAGVRGVEKLWVRKSGLECLADIHIEVDSQLTVAEGHRIGHVVKNQLMGEFTNLRDVLVHLEPFPHLHDNTRPRGSADSPVNSLESTVGHQSGSQNGSSGTGEA